MLKILGFDTGGHWIGSKRLEQGRFALGRGAKEVKRELNAPHCWRGWKAWISRFSARGSATGRLPEWVGSGWIPVLFGAYGSLTLSASDVAELEQENARLAVALGDAYAVLGKTKTALGQWQAQYDALRHELDWFKRQLFGSKSEKRLDMDDEAQLNLLAGLGVNARTVTCMPFSARTAARCSATATRRTQPVRRSAPGR